MDQQKERWAWSRGDNDFHNRSGRLLSISIPTTPDREELYLNLRNELINQVKKIYPDESLISDLSFCDGQILFWSNRIIEINSYCDNKEISIGEKRNRLYDIGIGKYSVQWDSDDWIAPDGLSKIIAALESNPDVVTYREKVVIDGVEFKSNHSIKYIDWEGDGHSLFPDGFHYHRTAFFKSVIRTDYCKQIGVADSRWGEDHDFARLIHPLLQTEVHIDEEIYHYIHNSTPHAERYGIKETNI